MAGDGHGVGMWIGIMLLVGVIASVQGYEDECSVELYAKIFAPSLRQMKTPYGLVQFFASWLPACQEFKPHYERVACIFNDPHAVHESEVYVTKVDCALESNKGLCDRFNVQSYPTMYWGPPEALASGNGFSEKLGVESIDGKAVSTDDSLLQWINKRINKQYSLTDIRPGIQSNETATAKQTSTGALGIWQFCFEPDVNLHTSFLHEKLPGTLHDVEEATAYAFSYMMDEKMMQASSRASFIRFLHLLQRHHPSQRCRKGSENVLQNISEYWPLRQPPANALRKQQLCGPGLPRGFWETCDGEARGYSCGLWLLLHSLTVRVEDSMGSFAISTIDAFVDHFYKCDQCRDHFLNETTRNILDPSLTMKDAVLWLWRTHNKITEGIASEESKANKNSTRKLWPLEMDCPACRDSSGDNLDWDDEAVYYYLIDFYGPSPQDRETEMSQRSEVVAIVNSVSVPYWAAVGIAMAGCGFAFATYYLRTHALKFRSFPRRT